MGTKASVAVKEGNYISLKDAYLSCRDVMKIFYKKKYWEAFTVDDLFYMIDDQRRVLFNFVDHFRGDSFGCQLFYNQKGMNYVHDILTANSEFTMLFGKCDSICAMFITRDELGKDEKDFIRLLNLRVSDLNLIIYRLEEGTAKRIANQKEMDIFFEYIEFLLSLIKNEYKALIENFKEGNAAISIINSEEYSYSLVLRPLQSLEKMPKSLCVNQEFVEEFKNSTYVNSECLIFTSFMPVVLEGTKKNPVLIHIYYPGLNKRVFKYYSIPKKEHNSILFGILYDVFTEIGIPTKIRLNNREIYSFVKKTLEKLHIEVSFTKEDSYMDQCLNLLMAYVFTLYPDENISEETLNEIMNPPIQTTLKELSDEEEENIHQQEEFVS